MDIGLSSTHTPPWQEMAKLITRTKSANNEVLLCRTEVRAKKTPLLICLPEHSRPGHIINDEGQLFIDLQKELGVEFYDESLVIYAGHVSVAIALQHARELIHRQGKRHVVVAACDTLHVGSALAYYEEKERLLTSGNSNGFTPCEAGAALLVESGTGRSGKNHKVRRELSKGASTKRV